MNERNQSAYRREDNDQINLWPIFAALVRKLWLLLLVAVICGVASYTVSKLWIAPTYCTYFTLYVNNSPQGENVNGVSKTDLSASLDLAQTASGIITSRTVRQMAADAVGMELDKIMVSTSVNADSGIITVLVTTYNQDIVADCAEAVADATAEQVQEVIEGSLVKLIDTPERPNASNSPNCGRNALIAGVLGLVLVAAIIIVCTCLDDRVKSETELEDKYGIPVVGVIPTMSGAVKNSRRLMRRRRS